jgi:hypothetical protein
MPKTGSKPDLSGVTTEILLRELQLRGRAEQNFFAHGFRLAQIAENLIIYLPKPMLHTKGEVNTMTEPQEPVQEETPADAVVESDDREDKDDEERG